MSGIWHYEKVTLYVKRDFGNWDTIRCAHVKIKTFPSGIGCRLTIQEVRSKVEYVLPVETKVLIVDGTSTPTSDPAPADVPDGLVTRSRFERGSKEWDAALRTKLRASKCRIVRELSPCLT